MPLDNELLIDITPASEVLVYPLTKTNIVEAVDKSNEFVELKESSVPSNLTTFFKLEPDA
jgi:hypothetical protein